MDLSVCVRAVEEADRVVLIRLSVHRSTFTVRRSAHSGAGDTQDVHGRSSRTV
jgi:hypothetical protein